MLVSCVCMVVARENAAVVARQVRNLGAAARAMDIAMTDCKTSSCRPTLTAQIAAVEDHAARSAAMLAAGGEPTVWLEPCATTTASQAFAERDRRRTDGPPKSSAPTCLAPHLTRASPCYPVTAASWPLR